MLIREINIGDDEQFVKLICKVDAQSDYMLYEPGERKVTVEKQRFVDEYYMAKILSTKPKGPLE
ncbi:hypothetical protein V7087_21660 [Neobacillus niacini]|uniref:hypothetical protein n=1 Tax=Neobacillus niacini TaxID=86668 RepID=UPI002FFF2C07